MGEKETLYERNKRRWLTHPEEYEQHKIRVRNYQEKHREEYRLRAKKWNDEHRDRRKQWEKEYYRQNYKENEKYREAVKERNRLQRARNKLDPDYLAQKRVKDAAYRVANKELISAHQKAWRDRERIKKENARLLALGNVVEETF